MNIIIFPYPAYAVMVCKGTPLRTTNEDESERFAFQSFVKKFVITLLFVVCQRFGSCGEMFNVCCRLHSGVWFFPAGRMEGYNIGSFVTKSPQNWDKISFSHKYISLVFHFLSSLPSYVLETSLYKTKRILPVITLLLMFYLLKTINISNYISVI